jgi:fatty-acyl-CoA synthase
MTDPARPAKPHKSPAEVVRTARRHTARTGLGLAVVAILALAFAPFGVHEAMFGLDYAVATVALGWAGTLAVLAVIVSVLAVLLAAAVAPRRGFVVPLLSLALAAGVLAATGQLRAVAASNPPVHEAATDWGDPLMFGPRASAARGPEANDLLADPRVGINRLAPTLEGQRVAEINARTCPGAVPAVITGSVAAAYDKTRAALLREGLTLVTENAAGGRLEATGATRLLKLPFDVVARIQPEGAGARVDFRSVSRTGEIDLGDNCRRVTRLRKAVAG